MIHHGFEEHGFLFFPAGFLFGGIPASLLFAFPTSLLLGFSDPLLLLSLLICFSASLLSLLICFSASLLSLLLCFLALCFCAFLLLLLYFIVFQSCVFAALLPAPLLPCLLCVCVRAEQEKNKNYSTPVLKFCCTCALAICFRKRPWCGLDFESKPVAQTCPVRFCYVMCHVGTRNATTLENGS